jgi:IS5 family transposase
MAEETLYDSEAMRRFAGIELGDDRIPDETTILNFRHLLERHGLTETIFAEVNAHLSDKGHVSAEREGAFKGPGKAWGVMRKAPKGSALHPLDERANRIIAIVRARVVHPFRVIKRQFGHVETRCRGLVRNRAQIFTCFALGNLFLVRRRLMT